MRGCYGSSTTKARCSPAIATAGRHSTYEANAMRSLTLSTSKCQFLVILCALNMATAQSAQELLDSVLNPHPESASFSSYSSLIYYNATLYNETPIASTNYDRLEESAKLRLAPEAYDYAAGGVGLERTVAANRAAFDKVRSTLRWSTRANFRTVVHHASDAATCHTQAEPQYDSFWS
jgi:hypothetical protein